MTFKRRFIGLLAAISVATGMTFVAASPAHAATCYNQAPVDVIELNDSYECLGPQYHWTDWTATHSYVPGACYNLTAPLFTDALHPAPNRWGNAVSSLDNGTPHQLVLYDGNGCTSPFGVTIGPGAWYDRPPAAVNNKISSIWIRCINVDCST